MKEVKKKAKYKLEELKCSMSRRVCKKIYEVSNIRGVKIAHMVDNHNKELQAALIKTEKFEAAEAMKMKYNICESAAKDMKYFSNKFLYGPIAQAATVAKAVGKHKAEAQAYAIIIFIETPLGKSEKAIVCLNTHIDLY